MESQKTKVLNYLKAGNSLTPLEALNMFGSMRLAAIIEVLRNKEGYNIINDNSGKLEKYARYALKEGKQVQHPESHSKVESPVSKPTSALKERFQHDLLCSCGKSYHTVNGRCNRCGVER